MYQYLLLRNNLLLDIQINQSYLKLQVIQIDSHIYLKIKLNRYDLDAYKEKSLHN